MENAKWFDSPERPPALIFRRTYTELKGSGGLWDEACALYSKLGAEMVESKMEARFPSGYKVQFRHMQHDTSAMAWNGKNIGDVNFDEANFFTEFSFWQMLSCMRGSRRPRFRLTMNPDPDSWLFKFVEPYLLENGEPDPTQAGKIRWFGRRDGKLVWFESPDEARRAGVPNVTSFTFIPSKLTDNPILLQNSPEYATNLASLPPLERARYLAGNWKIKAKAGSYFQSAWFPRITPLEMPTLPPIVRWFYTMDLASTPYEGDQVPGAPVETSAPDPDPYGKKFHGALKTPDWSIIILWAQLRDKRLIVWDVWRHRDTAGAIEWLVVQIARQHKMQTKHAPVVQWQDPAQAGVHQNSTYSKALRGEARLITTPSMNPELVATLASRASYNRQILIRSAAANRDAMLGVLEGFPTAEHDDDVSALGLGVVYALEQPALTTVGALPAVPAPPAENEPDIRAGLNLNPRWKHW